LRNQGTDEGEVVFVSRHITRDSADVTELEVATNADQFAANEAAGLYALVWEQHGTKYGVPAGEVDAALAEGGVVVINVSRAVLAEASRRYVAHPPPFVCEQRRDCKQYARPC